MSEKEFKLMSKTFCPLPWVHTATYTSGELLPCCVASANSQINLNDNNFSDYWNSNYNKEVRRKMIKGEPVEACSRCYVEEASGYRSHRVMEIEAWQRKLGEGGLAALTSLTKLDGSLESSQLSLDLRLVNLYNLQCVMCRQQDYSKWLDLASELMPMAESSTLKNDFQYKLQAQDLRFDWHKRAEVWEEVYKAIPNLKEIILGGGEPLLFKAHRNLLEECVRQGHAHHILLRYHTNLTRLPDDLVALWEKFETVEIFASVDAVGKKNNYLRYLSSWEDIEKNLKKLEEDSPDNLKVCLLASLHAMNIFYVDELCQWIQEQNFKKVTHGYNGHFHPGIVHHPEYLYVQVLPGEVKEIISQKIARFEKTSLRPSQKINGVVNFMNSKDQSEQLPALKKYISFLDKIRSTTFRDTFVELSEYLWANG